MATNQQPKDTEPISKNVECPRCGCRHLFLIDTRKMQKRIIQIRECRHCGRRLMSSAEISR